VTPLRNRLSDLERKYQALGLVLATAVGASGGAPKLQGGASPPLSFPPTLDAPMQPAGFREASKAILEKCFPALRVQDAECEEYPCIAWSTYDAEQGLGLDMRECAEWNKTMGDKSFLWQRRSDDGSTGYLGVASLPEDSSLEVIAAQHLHRRLGALGEAYGIRKR
jgi:hypothetical protein